MSKPTNPSDQPDEIIIDTDDTYPVPVIKKSDSINDEVDELIAFIQYDAELARGDQPKLDEYAETAKQKLLNLKAKWEREAVDDYKKEIAEFAIDRVKARITQTFGIPEKWIPLSKVYPAIDFEQLRKDKPNER